MASSRALAAPISRMQNAQGPLKPQGQQHGSMAAQPSRGALGGCYGRGCTFEPKYLSRPGRPNALVEKRSTKRLMDRADGWKSCPDNAVVASDIMHTRYGRYESRGHRRHPPYTGRRARGAYFQRPNTGMGDASRSLRVTRETASSTLGVGVRSSMGKSPQ